jgi:hypothetical protein
MTLRYGMRRDSAKDELPRCTVRGLMPMGSHVQGPATRELEHAEEEGCEKYYLDSEQV